MKRKILFIITYLELGGAQKQLFYILQNLNKDEYSVYLYAGNSGYLKGKFLSLCDVNTTLDPFLTRKINPFLDIIVFFRLFVFIKAKKIDIVHTHSPKASVLGRWAAFICGRKNIIYTVHGWPFHKFMNPLAYNFNLFLEKITAKITKKIITVSQADLDIGINKRIAKPDKISLIHYGIETGLLDKACSERIKKEHLNMIFTIASLKEQKGIFYFLNIAKILMGKNPELNFVIAGDGPLRKAVEREINAMGLDGKVYLRGWCEDVSVFFEQAAIFLLTSLWEGLPIALIEAVICAVPVVVTNTGGVLDIVKNYKQGIIVNPADISEAAKACEMMLKSHKVWSKIVINNRKEIDQKYWSAGRMMKQIESVYAAI